MIDEQGRAVSAIQSTYFEFGSGLVLPRTGVIWQNRGASFRIAEDGWNALKPGRKPFHTLNPAFAELSDGRRMVYGTMGGEGQPQTQAAVFTRYALMGQDLQAAVTAPRWLLGRTWGDDSTTLKLESRFDPATVAALKAAGHAVEMACRLRSPASWGMPEPWIVRASSGSAGRARQIRGAMGGGGGVVSQLRLHPLVVIPGLVPGTHASADANQGLWIFCAGTSPAMTWRESVGPPKPAPSGVPARREAVPSPRAPATIAATQAQTGAEEDRVFVGDVGGQAFEGRDHRVLDVSPRRRVGDGTLNIFNHQLAVCSRRRTVSARRRCGRPCPWDSVASWPKRAELQPAYRTPACLIWRGS